MQMFALLYFQKLNDMGVQLALINIRRYNAICCSTKQNFALYAV